MKKSYLRVEITVIELNTEDIMSTSGLGTLDARDPIYDNLDPNELPIF